MKTFIFRLWNQLYGIHCSIFSTLEIILSPSEVPLPRYERKCSFAIFEIGFTAFAVLFLIRWRLFWVDPRYYCQYLREIIHSPAMKSVLWHSLFYFSTLKVIFSRLKVPLPRYKQKRSFASFETGFTAFVFLLYHFGGYFVSIGGTVVKIQAKMFICRLWNRLYGIPGSIFRTLEVIFSRSYVSLPRYWQKCSLRHSCCNTEKTKKQDCHSECIGFLNAQLPF